MADPGRFTSSFSIVALAMLAVHAVSPAKAQNYDPQQWSALKYRNIGPIRGGRVTAVTGVASEPYTYYMGSTGGGVWKTTNAGHTWNNISDGFFAVASIGAMEVAPSDPKIIYVGTGSSKIRSNVSVGRGMYKSTDAGRTWSFIGLPNTGQIATVRIDPANPDVVYVAAQGDAFKATAERGIYKTTDGGKTWKLMLHTSDTAGAADVESPATPTSSSPACGMLSESLGPSSAARKKAAFTNQQTVA